MSRVYVCGLGAVSPAGWGIEPLRKILSAGVPLPIQPLPRPGWQNPLRARLVPPPSTKPNYLAHPRLRRTSPITHYTVAAGLEAFAGLPAKRLTGSRIGLIACLQSGCVQYSQRFFQETLEDPATASPLLFPETVFAAPVSHLAALLGAPPQVYTLVGDPSAFLQGVALAAHWLAAETIDLCIILGAEETNWLLADAVRHFERSTVVSSGAGALCLTQDPALSLGVELTAITDPHTYRRGFSRHAAAHAMRAQLPQGAQDCLLVDGISESPRSSAPETSAWADWTAPRVSPKRILGEGLMAAAAWQCVVACDVVAAGRFGSATVSLVGANQQALGAQFTRTRAIPAQPR